METLENVPAVVLSRGRLHELLEENHEEFGTRRSGRSRKEPKRYTVGEVKEWIIIKKKVAKKKNVKNTAEPKQKKKEMTVKEEKNDSEDDDGHELSSYEKMIQGRRAEKLAILESIGINQVKVEFSQAISSVKKPQPAKKKKSPIEYNLPPRKSRRVTNRSVDYSEKSLAHLARLEEPAALEVRKEIPPELSYKDALKSDSEEKYVKDLSVQESKLKYEFLSYDKSVFQSMSLSPSYIAKVVPSRVTASSWYPSMEKLILASGDKFGHLGLWNVDKDSDPHVFEIHTRAISNLQFNPYSFEHLISSSYDGTVRCCDLVKQTFNQVYGIFDKSMCTYFDIMSSTTCLVSQMNGQIILIDTRSEGKSGEKRHKCHDYSIKTVNIHPVNRDVFVTAGCKNSIRVWDLRKLQTEPVVEITHHEKSVNSAFFSSVTGNSILSTSMDGSICIFDSTNLLQEAKLHASLKFCIPITDIKSMINSGNCVLTDKSQIPSANSSSDSNSMETLKNVPIDVLSRERLHEHTVKESDSDEEDVKPVRRKIVKIIPNRKILTESESDDSEDKEWIIKKRKIAKKKNVKNTAEPKQKKKEMTVKEEKNDSEDDDGYELSSYEKMIEARRAEKLALLESMGINEVKVEFSQSISSVKKPQPAKRAFKKKSSPSEYNLPPRKSRRLANLSADYSENSLANRIEEPVTLEKVRKEIPPELSYKDALKSDSEEKKYVKDLSVQESKLKYEFLSYDKSVFQSMSLSPSYIAKVVPSRVTASSWYPSIEKLILASGDKFGHLGLWNVDKDSDPHVFEIHTGGISNLQFNPYSYEHLISSSYDGTVRCCDLVKQTFNQVYDISDKSICTYLDVMSSTTYLVSQMNGQVALIDTRSEGKSGEKTHRCHDYSIKTVNIHPVNKYVFVTAERKNSVRVWDLRKLQTKPVVEITHHKRSVNSAFFSPVTGNSILTTSMDDSICIFDSTNLLQEAKLRVSMKHNNCTGRWLSIFRACWLPNSDEAFMVGSMDFPRRIEIFDKDMKKYHTVMNDNLTTITSVNVLHPFRPALAGNNSSGKVFVFA